MLLPYRNYQFSFRFVTQQYKHEAVSVKTATLTDGDGDIIINIFKIKDEDDRQKYLAHNNYSIIVESSTIIVKSTVKYDASTFDVYFVDIIYYYFF